MQAAAQLEIIKQQAPGAFKALIVGLYCPGASICADAQPGSQHSECGGGCGAAVGPTAWLGAGPGSLSWKSSPVLRASQPVLEVLCPSPAGKTPAVLPSLKSLNPCFARGMSF